jgi:hypothetical protein
MNGGAGIGEADSRAASVHRVLTTSLRTSASWFHGATSSLELVDWRFEPASNERDEPVASAVLVALVNRAPALVGSIPPSRRRQGRP